MKTTPAPKDALARMLAVRDVSIAEAEAKLAKVGVAPAEAKDAVAWACGVGYLDDAKLAARLVERELARKPPPAPALIAHRLEARGLARALAAQAVRDGAPREVVRERLAAYLASAGNKLAPRRLMGRLVRAGHAPDDVADLIQAARGASADEFE